MLTVDNEWNSMPSGCARWWLACRLPVVGAGVALLELALVGLAGGPARQLAVLRGLGGVGADPLASLLAVLALAAEGLAAYLLLVVALRAVALLPGAAGRLSEIVMLVVAPATVRRALDVLVGGALLAQSTLAPLPRAGGDSPNSTRPVIASAAFGAPAGTATVGGMAFVVRATADPEGSAEPWMGSPDRRAPDHWALDRAPDRHASDRRAPVDRDGNSPVPSPPWLGGWQPAPSPRSTASDEPPPGPVASQPPSEGSGTARSGASVGREGSEEPRRGAPAGPEGSMEHREDAPAGPEDRGASEWGQRTVRPRDTLWDIAAARLPARSRSAATIDRYWRQVYAANRATIGADPDLIHPGTRLATSSPASASYASGSR